MTMQKYIFNFVKLENMFEQKCLKIRFVKLFRQKQFERIPEPDGGQVMI